RKMNYPGEGKLTRVEVSNATGKGDLKSGASLNLATGELTYYDSQFSPAFIEDVNGLYTITDTEPTEDKDFQEVMVLPVVKTNSVGSVMIRFFIDGDIYTYNVPYDTKWKQGTKYFYNVTFNGTELVVDDVIITDWTEGAKGEINLY
ncbi:MAG: fimbrillin family protein, partial [Dysgonomonas sp.]|uniref:fimbrillin family protein n=1 Tax=Dysgonomonas sp. TaxID=1891233 RepID=UPI003A8C2983